MTKLQYIRQWAREHDFLRRIRDTFENFPDRARPPRNWKWVKEWLQHGFSSRQTWGLDHQIAAFTLPRLKMLKEVKCGYPATMTEAEWDYIIDEMIYAMEYYKDDGMNEGDFDHPRVQRGIELFGKYFGHLWW